MSSQHFSTFSIVVKLNQKVRTSMSKSLLPQYHLCVLWVCEPIVFLLRVCVPLIGFNK